MGTPCASTQWWSSFISSRAFTERTIFTDEQLKGGPSSSLHLLFMTISPPFLSLFHFRALSRTASNSMCCCFGWVNEACLPVCWCCCWCGTWPSKTSLEHGEPKEVLAMFTLSRIPMHLLVQLQVFHHIRPFGSVGIMSLNDSLPRCDQQGTDCVHGNSSSANHDFTYLTVQILREWLYIGISIFISFMPRKAETGIRFLVIWGVNVRRKSWLTLC